MLKLGSNVFYASKGFDDNWDIFTGKIIGYDFIYINSNECKVEIKLLNNNNTKTSSDYFFVDTSEESLITKLSTNIDVSYCPYNVSHLPLEQRILKGIQEYTDFKLNQHVYYLYIKKKIVIGDGHIYKIVVRLSKK
jgi:hypothetical protein